MVNHTINKVTLDFSFAQKEKEEALQKTRQFFYDRMLVGLSAGFDAQAGNLYIDRLEIDVGETTEADFADNFLRALHETMARQPAETLSGKGFDAKVDTTSGTKGEGIAVADMISYLEKGYWPWYIQQKASTEITLLLRAFFESRNFLLSLFSSISGNRFIYPERLTDFLTANKKWQPLFFEALEYFNPFLKDSGIFSEKIFVKKQGDKIFNTAFIKKLFAYGAVTSAESFRIFLEQLAVEEQSYTGYIHTFLNEYFKEPGPEKLLLLFDKPLRNLPVAREPATLIKIPQIVAAEEEKKIGVDNAGLVLFHPYLKYVFKELKWINEGQQFVNENCRQKAVLLLQFLINGKSRQQEHLMVLNKVLCGCPVNLPLPTSCNFSAAEKQAVAEMMDSLIAHWTVIKNTSRAGLVKSFVERKGLLQKKDTSFLLQVEKNSIDILLDSLPYGIQTIKLPWNEYIIYTEWSY